MKRLRCHETRSRTQMGGPVRTSRTASGAGDVGARPAHCSYVRDSPRRAAGFWDPLCGVSQLRKPPLRLLADPSPCQRREARRSHCCAT